MNIKLKHIIAAAVIIVAASRYGHYRNTVAALQNEVNRLSVELSHAQIPLEREDFHDSLEAVEQKVVEVVPKKLKEALAADEQLIKDLELKVRQLEAMQTMTIVTADSVPAHHKPADSLFYYSDLWADIRLSLKDTMFYYNIRDSLSTLVFREYKHHFLWWRWGTKGYRLKIVNFNPHASVVYNRYIKTGK